MQAASQPSPWGDMEETAMVDNPADSVVHADASGLVSIIAPPGDGVPCTECHVQHRGTCSFHDRELKAWEDLGNEAALLPSPWNDMEESASIDNPVGSVVHADASGLVSFICSVQRQP